MKKQQEENKVLFKRLKECQEGTKEYEETITQIFNVNKSLMHSVVNRYSSEHSRDYEDIISYSQLGMLKAIKNFDTERGVKFSTYAFASMRNEIFSYFRENGKQPKTCSLNDPVFDAADSDISYEDTIRSDDDIERDLLVKEKNIDNTQLIRNLLKNLPQKQSKILEMIYLSGNDIIKQRVVGQKFGISKAAISISVIRSLRKLRRIVGEEGCSFDAMEVKKLRGELKKLIDAKLAPRQSQILNLLYFSGQEREGADVAQDIGLKPKTFYQTQNCAINRLVKMYNEKYQTTDMSTYKVRAALNFQEIEKE